MGPIMIPPFHLCILGLAVGFEVVLIRHRAGRDILMNISHKDWRGREMGGQGAVSIRKTVLPGMAIPMLKIRRPNGRLIFNMEIDIRR